MLYNCYYTVEISNQNYPGFKNKKEAIAIARTMTTNPVSDFDYEADEDKEWWYLIFQEKVIVESPDMASLEFQEINPQCEGAEFTSATKSRNNK